MIKFAKNVLETCTNVCNLLSDVKRLAKAVEEMSKSHVMLTKICQANNECIIELYELYDSQYIPENYPADEIENTTPVTVSGAKKKQMN